MNDWQKVNSNSSGYTLGTITNYRRWLKVSVGWIDIDETATPGMYESLYPKDIVYSPTKPVGGVSND